MLKSRMGRVAYGVLWFGALLSVWYLAERAAELAFGPNTYREWQDFDGALFIILVGLPIYLLYEFVGWLTERRALRRKRPDPSDSVRP